jgi:hypothetical protein
MRHMRRHIAVIVVLACTIGIAHAAEKTRKSKALPLGMFQIKVTKEHLTLEANEAPLAKIFEEIGKQAEIIIDSNLGPEERITIQLNQVALEEGINRLATNATIFYTQVPNDTSRRISRVIVLAEGTKRASASKAAEASMETSKTIESAPRPPPFRFEFEPATSMKTEKPQKKP